MIDCLNYLNGNQVFAHSKGHITVELYILALGHSLNMWDIMYGNIWNWAQIILQIMSWHEIST